jgi:acetyltransferase-like isoleucine patch superfamily enzyme
MLVDDAAALGSGVIVLPNVAIGRGAIATVLGGSRDVAENVKAPTN